MSEGKRFNPRPMEPVEILEPATPSKEVAMSLNDEMIDKLEHSWRVANEGDATAAYHAMNRIHDALPLLLAEVRRLREELNKTAPVIKAAKKCWLFERGYVKEGVEIPEDMNDDALEKEAASRQVDLYMALKAMES